MGNLKPLLAAVTLCACTAADSSPDASPVPDALVAADVMADLGIADAAEMCDRTWPAKDGCIICTWTCKGQLHQAFGWCHDAPSTAHCWIDGDSQACDFDWCPPGPCCTPPAHF
jgi:hypothetical protein